MPLFSAKKAFKFALISSLLFMITTAIHVSCFQYEVGENKGWTKPDRSEYESYNEWAQQNRFHIGDTLHFKYTNDSVLVVNNEDYANCAPNNPISKFEDGNTMFEFDHPGFYCFISGEPGHCQAGQKMIVRVMGDHHHSTISASPAASPVSSGPTRSQGQNPNSWGPSSQTRTEPNSGNSDSTGSILLHGFMGAMILALLDLMKK